MTDMTKTAAAGTDTLARLLHAHPETAYDYLEFRRLLAGDVAAFAASRATSEQVRALKECMDALEAAYALDDPAREAAADARFHLAILAAAGNVVMIHIMERLFGMLRIGVFYDRAALHLRRGVREGFLRQHQALFAAIAAGDADAARAVADAHISSAVEALREAQRADLRREVALRRRDGLALTTPARRGE